MDRRLEVPLILLGLAWLALLVIELWRGESRGATWAGHAIWSVFVAEFVLRWVTAPRRAAFLRKNWIAALSLALPALRVLRVFRAVRILRAARVTRGLRLVRVVSRMNRGLNSLSRVLRRRQFGYVSAATVLLTISGGAAMHAFEKGRGTFESPAEAMWWTAMLMTTMGSEHWPQSTEGRALCLALSLYAFAMFGYLTATLATWFIGSDVRKGQDAGSPR